MRVVSVCIVLYLKKTKRRVGIWDLVLLFNHHQEMISVNVLPGILERGSQIMCASYTYKTFAACIDKEMTCL